MSDIADQATKQNQMEQDLILQAAKESSQQFEEGQAGECDHCGEHFDRVVKRSYGNMTGMFCGRCRDELKLP